MAENFGLKIGLEGEKEFKKALAEINRSFKVLGSEMKLISSEFDKNDRSVEALMKPIHKPSITHASPAPSTLYLRYCSASRHGASGSPDIPRSSN